MLQFHAFGIVALWLVEEELLAIYSKFSDNVCETESKGKLSETFLHPWEVLYEVWSNPRKTVEAIWDTIQNNDRKRMFLKERTLYYQQVNYTVDVNNILL